VENRQAMMQPLRFAALMQCVESIRLCMFGHIQHLAARQAHADARITSYGEPELVRKLVFGGQASAPAAAVPRSASSAGLAVGYHP